MFPSTAASLVLVASLGIVFLQEKPPAPPAAGTAAAAVNPATLAAPRADEWWTQRQAAMNEIVKKGDAQLLFIGDSITQGWEGEGKEVWAQRYAPRKAVNLGIGGDQTQHVLWRLDHGNLDGIKPKVAVVMIGTNNTGGGQTAAQIAEGVAAVVTKLRTKLPATKVLLLAIFPRGEKPNPQRDMINEINRTIAKLADGKEIRFVDLGRQFLSADGSLPKEIMPDFLHLSPKGYEIWGDAIEPILKELLGEK